MLCFHVLTDAYIAGFFDGEGSISTGKGRYVRLAISIENTDLRILELIAQKLGGRPTLRKPRHNEKPTWRRRWEWHLCGNKAATVLIRLLPHLQIKREQAELALRIQAHVNIHRQARSPEVWAERHALRDELSRMKVQ